MDDDELEELIVGLRGHLVEHGFAWAADQAEASLGPEADRRTTALALLGAAESVTIELARVELAIVSKLQVEDIQFYPDVPEIAGLSLQEQFAARKRRESLHDLLLLERPIRELKAQILG
jgi:hypothetical protein